MYRQIRFRESHYAPLRLESYHTFNHTQFSNVSQQARFDAAGNQIDPLFPQPTVARPPRRLQLAMRLYG